LSRVLKLFERVYARSPPACSAASAWMPGFTLKIDRLYQRVIDDLDALVGALGLKAA
jgi:hypothetical protein